MFERVVAQVLEVAGLACIIAAAYLVNVVLALAIAGVALFVLAQLINPPRRGKPERE